MSPANEFTALDWIAVGLNVLMACALFASPFTVVPTFAGTFADFGARSALPAVTRLAMTAWPSLALGLVVATPTVMASLMRIPETIQTWTIP